MMGFVSSSPESADRTSEASAWDGQLLQRGGEEWRLTRLDDRFTACPVAGISLDELVQQIEADLMTSITMTPLTSAIVEFKVDPHHLEATMQRVRASQEVAFASHIYQLQDSPGTPLYVTHHLTLQFHEGVTADRMRAITQPLGLQVLKLVPGIPKAFVFEVTTQAPANPIKLANRLMRYAEVALAEPDVLVPVQPFYRPREDAYDQQWYLHSGAGEATASEAHIAIEAAWDVSRGSRSVIVAVLDDGFDLTHADLQGKDKIIAPKSLAIDHSLLPNFSTNHGTLCARLAVGEETGVGRIGVAPGCALMPVRMDAYLDDQQVEQLFEWVMTQGAAVVCCPWGLAAVSLPLSLRQRVAISRAATQGRQGKGCVIVFAAGNANRPIDGLSLNEPAVAASPLRGSTRWLNGFAIHPDVITVSGMTSLNQKAIGSNWGMGITVAAPCGCLPPEVTLPLMGRVPTAPPVNAPAGRSLQGTQQRHLGDGTSGACAIVAGVAALMLSVNPMLTAQQVKQLLQATADKVVDDQADAQLGLQFGTYDAKGYSLWFGYGRVNASAAVRAAQQALNPAPIPSRWLDYQNITLLDIPDNGTAGDMSPIYVEVDAPVCDIELRIYLEHSFLGDLEVYLVPPQGEPVLLQSRTLGRISVINKLYSLANVPMLQTVLNRSAKGEWRLQLVDRSPQNTGYLKQWQLRIGV